MKRLLVLLLLLLGGAAFAAVGLCSPFNKDPANASVVDGRLPDGGIAPDQPACCDERGDDACSECRRSVGAPVDTLNGFATMDRTDVALAQPWGPPVDFRRHYSTSWAQGAGSTTEVGRLGPGWSHSWGDYLRLSTGQPAARAILRHTDRGSEEYNLLNGQYVSRHAGRRLTWDAATQLYLAQRPDGTVRVFDASGRLRAVTSADGGEAHAWYGGDDASCAASATLPAGALCRVDFLFGRQLWFRYDANGQLARVARDAAFTAVVVDLAYTGGYPTSATGADGKAETYAYGFTHTHLTAAGVTVKLLTAATDADGKLVESFDYGQLADSPSRVDGHGTPEADYFFGWAAYDTVSTPHRVVRKSAVHGSRENLLLAWADGALTSTCVLDAAGNCDVTRLKEHVRAGYLDRVCEREASGHYTRMERDVLGRVVAEYSGLSQCDAVTPEAQVRGRAFGYLGDTTKEAFEALTSVDVGAPAGFRAFTAQDYTSPAAAIDALCGTPACLRPEAYSQPPWQPRPQRTVSVGRTLVDVAGTWGTQVRVTSYGFDAQGRPSSTDGPRPGAGDVTTYGWDTATGWALAQVTPPASTPVTYSNVDALGNAHTVVDENGHPHALDYDAKGRLTSHAFPGQSGPITWAYYDSGRLSSVTSPTGVATRYSFDADGALEYVRRMSGTTGTPDSQTHYVRRLKHLTDVVESDNGATVRKTQFGYDSQGRQALVGTPTLSARYEAYDEDGRLAWLSDEGRLTAALRSSPQDAKSHQYGYDAYGNLRDVLQLMAGGWTRVAHYTWDIRGSMASFTDAKGVTIRYLHDDFGRLVEVESPDFGLYRYVYDEADNVVQEKRPDGTVISYGADAANRLTTVAVAGATVETHEWGTQATGVTDCAGGGALPTTESQGRPSHVADAAGDWYFGYTQAGQLRFEALRRTGASCARTLWWEYDATGLLTALRYPSGARVEYGYPAVGDSLHERPNALTLVDGAQRTPLLSGIEWQAGEVIAYRTAGGVTWRLERDYDGSPWQVRLTRESRPVRERRFGVTAAGTFTPLFDGWRNPLAIEEALPQWSQAFTTNDFPALTGGVGPYGHQAFEYLASGDRDSADGVPYCYEAGTHRLASVGATTFRYAPDGSLWKRDDGGKGLTLCYGPQGTLASTVGAGGDVSRLVTNFRRQRVAEVWPVNGLREDFRVDESSRLLVEEGVGSLVSQYPRPIREYVWLGQHPVAVLGATEAASGAVTRGAVTFVHSGHLGEALAETDADGHVLRQYVLTPFGQRQELPAPRQAVAFETPNPYSYSDVTAASPGARAVKLHFTEVALASCDAISIREYSGGPELAWVTPASSGDVWTGWLPADAPYVELQSRGCGPARGFKLVELQADWGGVVSTAHSEATPHPYPAAGQQFRLAMGAGGYVRFTGVGLASCDALEARTAGGQTVWKHKPSVSGVVWSTRLAGDVDVGVWGQGCNATEGKSGFTLAEVRADDAPRQPVPLGLPGQRLRSDGTVDNWLRLYSPDIGRYLAAEPLLRNPDDTSSRVASGMAVLGYAYVVNSPLRYVDRDGLKVSLTGIQSLGNWWTAVRVNWRLRSCPAIVDYFTHCFGGDPWSDSTNHEFVSSPTPTWPVARTNYWTQTTTLSTSAFEADTASVDAALGATMAHELSHQMSLSTFDSLVYLGFAQPQGMCSADAFERLARCVLAKGCRQCTANECEAPTGVTLGPEFKR